MIAMRTPPASLLISQETVANSSTAGCRACYRIFLQHVATGAKGPMYDAFDVGIDGKPANRLVTRSRTPAFDVARIHADLGVSGCIEVWHVGGTSPAMFLDIETAAGLTVIDSEMQGPRFAPYRAFDSTQRAGMAIVRYPSEQGAASA